ncbi:MAG: phospholipase D-like domain-containing protein, partial [Thiohalophilus sp.]
MTEYTRILQPGRNCWRIRHAERIAFLIDGDNYFRALHSVLDRAKKQILISSWDIYSGIRIGATEGDTSTLAERLDRHLHNDQDLHVYLLNWDFSRLLDMGREWLPIYKFGWKTHPRLKFKLDSHHPVGASHHQKFVVLDDKLAFSGGLDITRGRWDTNAHLSNDTRRKQVDGTIGRPYHDVQIAISGDAAAALGDLFRERWRRATDQELEPVNPEEANIWPAYLEPDLRDVNIAISRTEAGYSDYQEVREVEQLYIDSIAAAKDYIYIENQFFTSPLINQALSERLLEKDGPEVVLNLPLETAGWLSQNSLDIIRVKLLKDLRQADQHGRLAIYYPFKKDLETSPINLHAKIMVIDDRFVRIGSSNLNNRSMGLDSECDISIEESAKKQSVMEGINHFRNRLLGEHLDCEPVDVAASEKNKSSLIAAIETLRERSSNRCLIPLEDKLPEYEDGILTKEQLVDPEQPINPESLLYHYLPDDKSGAMSMRIFSWIAGIILLLAIAGLWRFTELGQWIELQKITHSIEILRNYPFSVPLMIIGFVLATIVMVPITMLIVASIIVFGPWQGALYALAGGLGGAIITYILGSAMGRDALMGLAGGRINRWSQKLARHGVMTIVFVRIVPIAPFTIINLVAG